SVALVNPKTSSYRCVPGLSPCPPRNSRDDSMHGRKEIPGLSPIACPSPSDGENAVHHNAMFHVKHWRRATHVILGPGFGGVPGSKGPASVRSKAIRDSATAFSLLFRKRMDGSPGSACRPTRG